MPQPKAHFHLLIPADKSNVNLCKTLLTSTLLDYPAPTIYNWQGSSGMMAKITGAQEYLKKLDPDHDADLILIVDGFDMWFQLSPQVMIDRYHEINAIAQERINRQIGKGVANQAGITQKIVFASQKRCWPGEADHVSCTAVPKSQLPQDVYGLNTDVPSDDEKNPYLRIRQRYLNAGFVIGPAKEMRLLFERAQERALADPDQNGADQSVFATIWGEQELYRSILDNSSSSTRRRSEAPTPQKQIQKRNMFATDSSPSPNDEFSVGLDYESTLSLPTVFSEYDSDWLIFNNATTITTATSKNNITHSLAKTLQPDINADKLPFYTLSATAPHTEPKLWLHGSSSTPWNDVPLYTNLWTGVTPAIIHHNAHRDNLKALRESTWDKMWFQPFARVLLDARMAQPDGPCAVDKGGKAWYKYVTDAMMREFGYGARTDDGKGALGWQRWGELCGVEDQEEVFRDGGGAWEEAEIGETS